MVRLPVFHDPARGNRLRCPLSPLPWEAPVMTALHEITNFVQLTEDIGTSGQPSREQFRAIAAEGFEAVVNLALPTSDHAIADEGSIVTGLGMGYFHIPVRFDEPTVDDVRTFFGVMNALAGKQVWVHCVVNARVSAFLYLYLRQVRGLQEEAARSVVLERWEPKMDTTWRSVLALQREDIGF
jgi:protein tyrosine phosphatase (PTP) superfamily phosphohydrolase (DUF442 family)